MATYRLCGDASRYVSEPGEETSREGWISHHAICGPRETPGHGDRVEVVSKAYRVVHWTAVSLDEAPESCRPG